MPARKEQHSQNPTPHNRAFTLVELLVVIAVIAVLASLLLPALNRAKWAGYSTACQSNLHQWAVAIAVYVDDFNVYPPYQMSDVQGSNSIYWTERLERYTKSKIGVWNDTHIGPPTGISVCPSYIQLRGLIDGKKGIGCYAYNAHGYWSDFGLGGVEIRPHAWPPVGPDDIRPVKESEVLCPSDMIAVGDSDLWSGPFSDSAFSFTSFDDLSAAPVDPGICIETGLSFYGTISEPQWARGLAGMKKRHGGNWNISFCDAHVESPRIKRLFDYHSDDSLRRWNRDHQPHRDTVPGT